MDLRLGLLLWEDPDLFSLNLKKKGKEKLGGEGGRRDCQKHLQGCHLHSPGPFKMSVDLEQNSQVVGRKGQDVCIYIYKLKLKMTSSIFGPTPRGQSVLCLPVLICVALNVGHWLNISFLLWEEKMIKPSFTFDHTKTALFIGCSQKHAFHVGLDKQIHSNSQDVGFLYLNHFLRVCLKL